MEFFREKKILFAVIINVLLLAGAVVYGFFYHQKGNDVYDSEHVKKIRQEVKEEKTDPHNIKDRYKVLGVWLPELRELGVNVDSILSREDYTELGKLIEEKQFDEACSEVDEIFKDLENLLAGKNVAHNEGDAEPTAVPDKEKEKTPESGFPDDGDIFEEAFKLDDTPGGGEDIAFEEGDFFKEGSVNQEENGKDDEEGSEPEGEVSGDNTSEKENSGNDIPEKENSGDENSDNSSISLEMISPEYIEQIRAEVREVPTTGENLEERFKVLKSWAFLLYQEGVNIGRVLPLEEMKLTERLIEEGEWTGASIKVDEGFRKLEILAANDYVLPEKPKHNLPPPELIDQSYISQVRQEVKESPTVKGDLQERVQVLKAWVYLLLQDGANIKEFYPKKKGLEIQKLIAQGRWEEACVKVDEAYATLEEVEASHNSN